jgi:hypothetical protein
MEEHYFSEISSMFNDDQKMTILVNASVSYGMSQNFRESIHAQHSMMNYLKTLADPDRELMLALLKPYIETDDCVHLKGSRLIQLFIRYWFMFLESVGIKRSEVAVRYIPRVYGGELNDLMEIKSNLFTRYENESDKHKSRMDYFYKIQNRKPYWLNKMGTDNAYSGVDLSDFSFKKIYVPP